jgi:hypothetical protein
MGGRAVVQPSLYSTALAASSATPSPTTVPVPSAPHGLRHPGHTRFDVPVPAPSLQCHPCARADVEVIPTAHIPIRIRTAKQLRVNLTTADIVFLVSLPLFEMNSGRGKRCSPDRSIRSILYRRLPLGGRVAFSGAGQQRRCPSSNFSRFAIKAFHRAWTSAQARSRQYDEGSSICDIVLPILRWRTHFEPGSAVSG